MSAQHGVTAPRLSALMQDINPDRARAAVELQQLLLDTEDLSEFLNDLARYAADTVAPMLSCGITLERDGNPLTAAGSDALAFNLDEIQYGHHDGPCLNAMRHGAIVHIRDLATDDRWGAYRLDALAHGIVSALSIPLNASPGARGALNLYASEAEVFDADRRAVAEGLADEASRALRLAIRLADQAQLSRHLETAMASRSVIDQAIGIIMGQNRCASAEAFEILRRASNHRNTKLRDIASEIVTRISGHPPDPDR